MIVVLLGGGVGNQLFQYAAARALSLRLRVPLALDTRDYDGRAWRQCALDAFAIETAPVDRDTLPPLGGGLLHALRGWLGQRSRFTVFKERTFTFDPSVLTLSDGTWLKGYFQSELYFADQAEALRHDLAFRQPPDEENRLLLDEIADSMAVSLHVRRGDYVSSPRANQVHGAIGVDFYRRAAQHVAERCGRPPAFFVFTDDPDWVGGHLDIGFPFRLVRHNLASRDTEDLRLMAACRHHILANSSFSWWGAWLDPSPEAIVVAPKPWFKDPTMDESTLLPARWVRL